MSGHALFAVTALFTSLATRFYNICKPKKIGFSGREPGAMSALAPGRLAAAAMAFVLWGGWALFANWPAGQNEAVIAGLLQGCASAIITLVMAGCVGALFKRLPAPLLRIVLPPLLIVSVSFSALWLAHTANATPALWATILPPSALAFAYCLYLTLTLARDASASSPEQ